MTKQPLSLPFFDDFSKPFKKLFPDTSLWQAGFSTWVNDGMGINPPTINVVTFDGLDSAGNVYNPNDILANGFRDSLFSQPINLSTTGLDSVKKSERSSVYLSFFYQWKGNGEAPDNTDYLLLEFKNQSGGWESVMTIQTRDSFRDDVFYDTTLAVSGDQFFHSRFQFRFRSYGRLSGPYDTWNLDYVYLNKGRTADDLSFPDRALATQPGPLFGLYRAMPRRHFFVNPAMTPPHFEIQNMKNIPASVNFRTEAFFSNTNRKSKTTTTHQVVLGKATPINITDNVILANEHKTIHLDTLPDPQDALQFVPEADSTLIRLTVALQSNDDIPRNNFPPIESDSTGDYTPNYRPIKFTTNDTLRADYALSSYYAYDDGFAEYSAGLIQPGNLVAYEFDMPFTSTLRQDTLVAFDIYVPPSGVSSNQIIDFFIYHDKAGFPDDSEPWLSIPARPVNAKGVNVFQRIRFIPALLIDEQKFYIGWRQPVSGKMMVGLDISNDTGNKMFVNTTGSWYLNDEVTGSLMVRPIFGSGEVDIKVATEEEEASAFTVYPNPNTGSFYIEGPYDKLEILSSTGQRIPCSIEAGSERTLIQLREPPGLYLLRYSKGKITRTRKLVITR
jgi:hypothetical protein